MNRNGTHVGRPAYTPEQRMEASKRQFLDGLTKLGPLRGDHWHQSRSYFLVPEGTKVRKVRKGKFAFILAYPNVSFSSEDRVYVQCPDKECVNPKHMRYVDASKKVHQGNDEGDVTSEDQLIDDYRTSTSLGERIVIVKQLKAYWRDNPISDNDPAVDVRMEFFPPDTPDDDAEAMRALAAEYGITVS